MDHAASVHDAVCILERADRDFHIGVVGTGPGLESILQLMTRPELEEFFPRMHLVACAFNEHHPSLEAKIRALGAVRHEDCQAMLAAHPEINLIIELTGRLEQLRTMRQFVPAEISLMDHGSALFLCALLVLSQVSNKCKAELNGQQSLLHTVMDEMNDDVVFLDLKGRILDVNKHVCLRLGKDKNELLDKPCWEAGFNADQAACKPDDSTCPFQTTLRDGREAVSLRTMVDGKGRISYHQVHTYPVFSSQGGLSKVIEVRRDVTLRTEIEKRLQQAEKLAAIGELSTYIAHEIRNPLFAIGGFANSLLRSSDLTEASRNKARVILEESNRLDKILKSIINFARPTKAVSSEVDVNEVVRETVQLLGIGCKERGIKINVRLAADLAKVRGDAELLKQCLINLIKNALEAMPRGGTLTVSSGMETHYVHVVVKDTGAGIPPEAQEMIFNPFYTTKKKEGSGLGLAMTKKIIGDLGGSLRLESQVGSGTTVTVLLPPYVPLEV